MLFNRQWREGSSAATREEAVLGCFGLGRGGQQRGGAKRRGAVTTGGSGGTDDVGEFAFMQALCASLAVVGVGVAAAVGAWCL